MAFTFTSYEGADASIVYIPYINLHIIDVNNVPNYVISREYSVILGCFCALPIIGGQSSTALTRLHGNVQDVGSKPAVARNERIRHCGPPYRR